MTASIIFRRRHGPRARLCERVLPKLGLRASHLGSILEPACGEGHVAEVLREYQPDRRVVVATDIFDYGYNDLTKDFLADAPRSPPRWIITNPPFGDKAIAFVQRALELATGGVAMFFRSQWAVEGLQAL